MTSPDQFRSPERGSPQPQGKPSLRNIPSAIPRYGLAVVSIALSLLTAFFLERYKFHRTVLSLFLFAIALTVWYAGVGPAVLAIVLSILSFLYFFSPPIYSFAFSVADVPAIVILLSFAVLIVRFSAVRRRIEGQLLQARDELQTEVVERTQQASLLNLTHDAIFVRDMSAIITYWNRGAEEMYGWTADEACGDVSHRLLKTVFPEPLVQIEAKLMSAGRWEGELVHSRNDGTPVIVASRWSLQQNDQGTPIAILEINNDISEQKRAEQARRRSEAYLAEAQRLSKTGSWAFKPGMAKPVYWSDEMFRIWGFDPRQGLPDNETAWQRIHPEDFEAIVRQQIEQASTGSFKVDIVNEIRIVLPDGTLKYLRGTAHPVFNDTGKVVEYVGTSADVTEHKEAEEALLRSEAYLAESQRLTKTGSWAYNPFTRKTIYWSDEMFRIFGIDPQEGPSSEKFWQRVHQEDLDRVRARVEREAQDKTEYVDEYRVVLPDGTVKHVLDIGHPVFSGAGDVTEFVGTTVDVTERKRAEETLRRSEAYLAEGQRLSHTGSWAYSHALERAIYWSEETFRIFGLDPQRSDPPYYDQFIRLIHPEDRDRFRENTLRCFREKVGFTQEYRLMLPDGTVKYIHEIGHPVLDGSAKLVEYLGTLIDVTERKRAEEEIERLRRLEADLARVNRVSMMGELAASLAHEIKQPIAAAATNARTGLRWLQREPPDAGEAREALSRIVNDAKRAADIIERNRSLYRRDMPQRETVNLNEVVREMIALLQDAANRQSVSIRAELVGDVPTMSADRVQMQQVLMNLMLNGIEAMKDTGGELTIRSEKTEDRQVLLSVSDVGIGLPAENADRVFDAFFTTKAQGTGMGLSICRRIIESHGGRLWACANAERGTTFHFTLPTAASTSSTPAA